jgi:hypothetical protein
MSSTDATAAVERIRTDEPFARAVAEQGPDALAGFDLTDPDRTAIVEAVRRDVAEADAAGVSDGEVEGFAAHHPIGMPFTNLMALELGGGGPDQTTITTPPDERYPTKPGKLRHPLT